MGRDSCFGPANRPPTVILWTAGKLVECFGRNAIDQDHPDLRRRRCPVWHRSRSSDGADLRRIFFSIPSANFSHTIADPACAWLGSTRYLVGRRIAGCAPRGFSQGRFAPKSCQQGTRSADSEIACGCGGFGRRRGSSGICTKQSRNDCSSAMDCVCVTASETRAIHGRLVGAHRFLFCRLFRGNRALYRDVPKQASNVLKASHRVPGS